MGAVIAAGIVLAGLIVGFAAAWMISGRELTRLHEASRRAERALAEATERGDSLARQLEEERVAHAALAAEHGADARAHAAKLAELTALRDDIETRFRAFASEVLHGSQQSFLSLAGEVFDKHRQAAATLLGEKEKAIQGLLAPINASLEEYRKGLAEIEKAREAAYGGLAAQLAEMSRETRKLVTALRAPQTRGRWGEQQLRNVIELAGMTAHVDYLPQHTLPGPEGRLRPDLVIRVPGDRRLVVDAKTPLLAYLDAVEAADDAAREAHLHRHAQQLRSHMKQLSDKRYWEALRPLTPDFVVMFIPGENFYSAAVERDPALFEDAVAARVLIVTPTTLIALAKAIASGWSQAKLAEDARYVAELGRELYRRLAAMGGHVVQLGASLRRSVEHYNSFVGSVEGSVMPQARRFTELAVDGTHEALPELKPVELDTRQVRHDRDLSIAAAE